LQDLIRMDGDSIAAVQELVREVLPFATQQFQPPHADFTYLTVLGYDTTELFRFGLFSLNKRLRAAGVPFPGIGPIRLPALDGEPIFPDRELTPVQQLMRPMRDQITPALVFQGLPLAFNPEAAKGMRTTFRFDITGEGGGTWNVVVDNGTCEIVEGVIDADWRFELDTDTWIGMTTGDFLGQEAFMLGKVTIEGNPIVGMAFDQLFTPSAA
jgi:hypothetical protein